MNITSTKMLFLSATYNILPFSIRSSQIRNHSESISMCFYQPPVANMSLLIHLLLNYGTFSFISY